MKRSNETTNCCIDAKESIEIIQVQYPGYALLMHWVDQVSLIVFVVLVYALLIGPKKIVGFFIENIREKESRVLCQKHVPTPHHARSEEHTSELQSRLHLVCR